MAAPPDTLLSALSAMWGSALSEVSRLDVRERVLRAKGAALSRRELEHRGAQRGIMRLIERCEKSPAILAELARAGERERAAAAKDAAAAAAAHPAEAVAKTDGEAAAQD